MALYGWLKSIKMDVKSLNRLYRRLYKYIKSNRVRQVQIWVICIAFQRPGVAELWGSVE